MRQALIERGRMLRELPSLTIAILELPECVDAVLEDITDDASIDGVPDELEEERRAAAEMADAERFDEAFEGRR